MAQDELIRVDGLWKQYGFPLTNAARRAWHRLTGRTGGSPERYALQDIHLKLRRGESVGIIGRNGAGKSTLLKVLAGVTPPTRGAVDLRGRVFPMLELNAGVHPELTGHENIALLSAIMGLSRREARRIRPAIEEFSELGDWLKEPVRKYSSGMLSRLGFSVAVHVPSDILLVDEVLAVGDLSFQSKCIDAIMARQEQVGTIFVSHNPNMMYRLCHRALVLDQGQQIRTVEADEIPSAFYEIMKKPIASQSAVDEEGRRGLGTIRAKTVRVFSSEGDGEGRVSLWGDLIIEIDAIAREAICSVSFGINIVNASNQVVVNTFTPYAQFHPVELEGLVRVRCRIGHVDLTPGDYRLDLKIKRCTVMIDEWISAASFSIVTLPRHGVLTSMPNGILFPQADWSLDAVQAGGPENLS